MILYNNNEEIGEVQEFKDGWAAHSAVFETSKFGFPTRITAEDFVLDMFKVSTILRKYELDGVVLD